MSIEGDIVEENVVDIGAPSNATNPITDIKPETHEEEPAQTEEKPATENLLPKGIQKRIDRAVRQRYEAEARAKMLEERLAALETRSAPPQRTQVDDSEPTLDKFDTLDQYVAAKAAYIAKKQIESTLSERETRQMAAYAEAERQKTAESWNQRLEKATAEMPDFEDVIANSSIPMTEPMQQAIMTSDVGPRLAYYLATHPDEAMQIVQRSPIEAIRLLGKIEAKLEATPVQTVVTSAPAPVKPLSGKSSVKKNPADMTDAEYAKWRKSGRAA